MKTIKPVLRLAGSKYKQRNKIINLFNQSNKENFVEVFGGTGIISVNLKANFPNVNVILNDFDNLFPLTKEKVELNLTTFEGLGKYKTKLAVEYYERRIKNGLWDKVNIYNNLISKINLIHCDYKQIEIPENSFVYLDPPYFKRDKLYKNNINHLELFKYIKSLPKSVIWLLSYDDNDFIKKLYQDYYILVDDFKYCAMKTKQKHNLKKELWISNFPWKI